MEDLKLSNYDYDLPQHMIADRPIMGRHFSKLLVYDEATDEVTHSSFINLAQFLPKSSTIVFNESKVFACRLNAKKQTGGKVEIFILEMVPQGAHIPCLLKSSGKKSIGTKLLVDEHIFEIDDYGPDGTFMLSTKSCLQDVLDLYGSIPIPPYIRGGESDELDLVDYQTTYAKNIGSVAAPTAGLHFTPDVFSSLEGKGIEQAFVNLHVGLGTFRPVSSEVITEHKMHSEKFFVEKNSLEKISNANKTIAVGTTALRVLESIYGRDDLRAGDIFETDIFLHPGKSVQSIDGLITNFHLPKSSLLMLVSTLIGRKKTLELYEEAKKQNYRFFSYGDAMLIRRKSL